MSLLAEILATADQVEMDDLNTSVVKLSNSVLSLKQELMDAVENTYIKFFPYFKDYNDLLRKATSMHSDLNMLHSRVENQTKRELSDSTGELENLKSILLQTDFNMSLAKTLSTICCGLNDATNKQNELNFSEAAVKLKQVECILNNVEEEIKLLDIYEALEEEISRLRGDFLCTVLDKWKPCIKWNEITTDSNKKDKEITLTVMEGDLKSDLVKALHHYDMLIIQINKFGDAFLRNILIPVIDKKSRVLLSNEEKYSSLVVQTKNVIDTNCVDVINNLAVIFNFLFLHFDINIDDQNNFISELGERIANDFIEYFIKNSLDKAVPKCQEKLASYTNVVNSLEHFEALLHERGFLPVSNIQLMEYFENVDVLVTNKICDSYLESARKLMKSDLHDMIPAGFSEIKPELNDTLHMQDVKAIRKVKSVHPPNSDHHVYISELSINTNQFPACQISKSAVELIELVNALLEESIKSKTDNCVVKLFTTARNIFKLYCDIVPLHHKKMLDTLPQQAALLNNNCHYLAHNLLTLGAKYKAKQPSTFQMVVTFVDLIDSLQSVGKKVLSNQIDFQKKQVLDILCDSGLVTVTESTEFPKGIEKAIRQCIRQMMLLQKVWHHVLPTNSYCESIGIVAYTFVQEIVDRVSHFIDIPAHTASELVSIFTIIQDKIPTIFPEPNEIYQHVENWTKFNELVKLLGASLQDVEERWSDGKGPLAQEFTADQVKQLIKALFQISDKRAELLSRIK